MQILTSDMSGPLPEGQVGIVLGRSSSTMKGLMILLGVIDPDYTGKIKLLCHSLSGVISIAPGDRIAQLLLLPSSHEMFPSRGKIRGEEGLGSTGVDLACLSIALDDRPVLQLTIEGKSFSGLVDTGADRSIIRTQEWPKQWPLQRSAQSLQGLGYARTPCMSSKELAWRMEDQQGRVQPFVIDLPINLWGRDVQQQLQLRLTNEFSEESKNMMKKQGFVPTKGLGKGLQGMPQPIIPVKRTDQAGLGFS